MSGSIIKVVHISTSSVGGAGTAAYRIHQALLANGVNSHFIYSHAVDNPLESSSKLKQPNKFSDKIRWRLKKYNGIFPDKAKEYNYELDKMRPLLQCEMSSIPFSIYNILKDPIVQDANIIHLHWVAEMLDYSTFFENNKKPVVWTLHDMNPFNGLFHYEEDEIKNMPLAEKFNTQILEIKRNFIQRSKNYIRVVSPSEWLLGKAMESNIFKNREGYCIRYALDTEIFFPKNCAQIKEKLQIPEGNTVFLFVAQSTEIYRKGFDLLVESLKCLENTSVTLLVAGNAEIIDIPGLDIRLLGKINDNSLLATYYSLADAFIIPSREDNLPNVVLEAMACGTPVLSFNVGGMAEVIIDGFNGLKAYKKEPAALLAIIEQFIKTKHEYKSEAIRNFAIKNFAPDYIAEEYKKVYESALKNNG